MEWRHSERRWGGSLVFFFLGTWGRRVAAVGREVS